MRADRRPRRQRPRAADARVRHLHGAARRPGVTITDDFLGQPRAQYLASEEEGARLLRAGSRAPWPRPAQPAPTPGVTATTTPKLFGRAPFDTAIRERSFGLVRADGSEKPAVEIIRAFASRLERGEVQLGEAPRLLDVTADEYYTAPNEHFSRLYKHWLEHMT